MAQETPGGIGLEQRGKSALKRVLWCPLQRRSPVPRAVGPSRFPCPKAQQDRCTLLTPVFPEQESRQSALPVTDAESDPSPEQEQPATPACSSRTRSSLERGERACNGNCVKLSPFLQGSGLPV